MKVNVTVDRGDNRGMYQEEYDNVRRLETDDDGRLGLVLGTLGVTFESDEWTAFAVEKES